MKMGENIFLIFDLKKKINTQENINNFFDSHTLGELNEIIDVDRLGKELVYVKNDRSDLANIKNWLRYKIFSELNSNADCDCLEEVHLMYNMLLDDIAQKEVNKGGRYFKINDGENVITLETDTMNSFAALFNQFMRAYLYPETHGKKMFNYGLSVFREISFLFNIDEWYKHAMSKTDGQIKPIFEEFNQFALYTHCPANMILVPSKFNTGRNTKETKDFWNLSMIYLQEINTKKQNPKFSENQSYEWYCNNIGKFINNSWIENPGETDFSKFIIKPLFKGQEYDKNKAMPEINDTTDYKNAEDFLEKIKECVSNVNEIIENRGVELLENPKLKNLQMFLE